MDALETGASSVRECSSSGQVGGNSECVIKKKIEIESKIFYLSAKKNNIGPFVTVSEQKKTQQQIYQVPAEPAKKYQQYLFLLEKAAILFRDELKKFWKNFSGPDNVNAMKSPITSTNFTVGVRIYYLQLKEDNLGRYLQVSCKQKDRYTGIEIPVSGLLEVHDKLAELIKEFWPTAESPEFAFTLNDVSLKHETDETTCIDAGRNKEDQGNLVKVLCAPACVDSADSKSSKLPAKSAAKRKSQQPTTEQAENSTTLYVAVQLRMSRRHTHLEVQVLVDNNKQALLNWQQAWNKNISQMRHDMNQENLDALYNKKKKKGKPYIKEKSDQPYLKRKRSDKPKTKNDLHQLNMPDPQPVILQDFDVKQPVAARLTGGAYGSASLIYYGCHQSTPCMQPRGFGNKHPHTWVFQLSGKPRSDTRQFYLHLHKAAPNDHDKAWGDEICNVFTFPDFQGFCFLSHLGFTQENQPVQRTPGTGDFGRIAKLGEVMNVQTLQQTMQYHQCIINYSHSVGWISGPKEGTGFCIGNGHQKYVMTCRHIFAGHEEDFFSGKFSISFSSFESLKASFVLRSVVAQDEMLDYAIVELEEPEKAPQPIPCCSINVDNQQYLTIIGYRAKGDLAFDCKVEPQMIEPYAITQVKDLVSKRWPHFPCNDYDEITSLAHDLMFYHVAIHKHGSSGSPVFLFMPNDGFKLVALHRCGFPKFYYDNENTRDMMTENYAVEAGTRLSSIRAHVLKNLSPLLQKIFI